MSRRWLLWRSLVAMLLLAAGCGSDDNRATSSPQGTRAQGRPPLTVSAAASLTNAFTAYGKQFPRADARFSFAGSDELAAQIEQGVKPDVYAAANTTLPDELFKKGLVDRPVVFAGNRLVLAVPAGGPNVPPPRGGGKQGPPPAPRVAPGPGGATPPP